MEEYILHHHGFVALEHRIRRQVSEINRHHVLSVDREAICLAAFRPRFWRAPFLFRGEVLGGRLRRVGLDRGLTLLALEPVDLVAQTLDFRLGCPQVSLHVFQQVEQPPDEFARLFICDAVQVKVFEHSAACSSGETLSVLRVSMPVFPPRGNLLQMGFQPRIFEVIPVKRSRTPATSGLALPGWESCAPYPARCAPAPWAESRPTHRAALCGSVRRSGVL